jgi:HK97 family phage prohead protease
MIRVIEQRDRPAAAAGITVRQAADGAPPLFYGHPAVVDSRTAIGDPLTWGFFEQLDPNCFDRTLADPLTDSRFLIDHDSALIVSRQSAGDLTLGMDAAGLGCTSGLDQDVSYVRDFTVNVQKRRITGMSFGFIVRKDDWTTVDITATDDKGQPYTATAELRTILDLDLIEVSGVTFPAYTDTDAAVRAIRSNPDALRRREQLIRKTGPQVMDKRKVGRALDLIQELRVGKMLSQANLDLLQSVLDQLAAADTAFDPFVDAMSKVDKALDDAQADIAGLLDVANPDQPDPDDDDSGDDPNDPGEGAGDGQRSKAGTPVPPADYMRAFAIRHGQRLTT